MRPSAKPSAPAAGKQKSTLAEIQRLEREREERRRNAEEKKSERLAEEKRNKDNG